MQDSSLPFVVFTANDMQNTALNWLGNINNGLQGWHVIRLKVLLECIKTAVLSIQVKFVTGNVNFDVIGEELVQMSKLEEAFRVVGEIGLLEFGVELRFQERFDFGVGWVDHFGDKSRDCCEIVGLKLVRF